MLQFTLVFNGGHNASLNGMYEMVDKDVFRLFLFLFFLLFMYLFFLISARPEASSSFVKLCMLFRNKSSIFLFFFFYFYLLCVFFQSPSQLQLPPDEKNF